ncbi:MAG: hypothetical protein HRU19_13835 [Pseudobacteriovorax sp.]|nr:hypothetical protein [Pseudobacteriovorax sp.]
MILQIAEVGFSLETGSAKKMLEQANKLIFVKEYQEAGKVVQAILDEEPRTSNLLIHLRRIELSVKLGTVESVKEEYEQILVEDPSSTVAQICLVLAEQHGELISPDESLARLQSLLKSIGPHAAIYYGIGFSMEMDENFERALYNYRQCINTDHDWYPGYFGLSQIYYHLGDEEKGDHFFYLFEELAPYNVYGNFETHQRLAAEYLQREEYERAEKSISTLSEWWMDNKGYCPIEIQIYERFASAKIADLQQDPSKGTERRKQGEILVGRAITDDDENEGVLYFIAKVLEEYSQHELALKVYKKILSNEISSPEIVQKIGSHFLSLGEHHLAEDLFEEAYKHHPDNPEIRFCWRVSKLRNAGINVEEYLIQKERLKSLVESQSDKVELLSLLHSLVAKYDKDPDIHSHMGDVYLKLGNVDRARRHFLTMYELDPESLLTKIKYITFEIQHGDPKQSRGVLDSIDEDKIQNQSQVCEIKWLKANYAFLDKDFEVSLNFLSRALQFDPWNVTYLVQQALALSALAEEKVDFNLYDKTLKLLSVNSEEDLDWNEFRELTKKVSDNHLLELDYCRSKISFLYADGAENDLVDLVKAACKLDAGRSTYDFLKLLNTNFDSPNIYWALGYLYKDLWQLEVACVWFEQILISTDSVESHHAKAYLELADCYTWQSRHLDKAVEYSRMALDLSHSTQKDGIRILAHALLRRGDVRQAEVYLEELDDDTEAVYLRGLLHYRNGNSEKANEIWKPLLTITTLNLRMHTIKQQVMEYYFEKVPYKGIN